MNRFRAVGLVAALLLAAGCTLFKATRPAVDLPPPGVDALAWAMYAHVTADVDVTSAWNRCRKPGGPSFFLVSLYLMLKAANETEA